MTGGDVLTDEQPSTLWLRVQHEDSSWKFELAPDEERAIVVGSLLRAHVRIERDNIAPVHFHFEREGDRIKLIPGYRHDLRINSEPVQQACFLEPWSVIEFSQTSIEVEVSKRPFEDSAATLDGGAQSKSSAATQLRQWQASVERQTMAFAPLYDVHLRPKAVADEPAAPIVRTEADPNHDAARALPWTPQICSEPILRVWFREDPTPVVRGRVTEVSADEQPFSAAPESKTDAERVSLGRVAESLIVHLGIATRKRPLVVLLAACGGSVIIGLALLALSRIWATATGAADGRAHAPMSSSSANITPIEPKEDRSE